MYSFIEKRACELAPVLTRHRRNLHQIPETGWNEKETCSYIAAELRQLGYEVLLGGPVTGHETGIIASRSCGNGPVSVLRFDIDALPTEEDSTHAHLPAREHFCSRNPGAMHACGHDGHIAIGLGCARIFTELSSRLSGTIRLIFQPAEEGCKGAGAIVERGWLDDASLFLAGHIVRRNIFRTFLPRCSSGKRRLRNLRHGFGCTGIKRHPPSQRGRHFSEYRAYPGRPGPQHRS